MSDDTRYAYAVGRIRVLETRLLDKSRFDSLVEARNAEEVLKALSDTAYGPFLAELKEVRDFEEALNGELKSVLRLVSELSQDAELTDIFRLRYDFHNLKVFLKIKGLGSRLPGSGPRALIDAGLIGAVKMKNIVEEDNYRALPRELQAAGEKAAKAFRETHDAQQIDIILDREMYALFSQRTREKSHPFLREYVQLCIDLTNIKTVLRVKESGRDKNFFSEVFLEGGALNKSLFLRSYEESMNNFASLLSSTSYGALVSAGIKYRQENRSWSELERLADNYLISFLKRAKYIVFGLEPIVAYLLARENEVKMIRMIMIGKLNGLAVDLLRSRLRDIY